MFILRSDTQILILLLYVDDIILKGSASSLLYSFIAILSCQFAMKDMGDIHYFLGVRVSRSSAGWFLSQQKYTSHLLQKFHLHTYKHVCTPVVARASLTFLDGELLAKCTKSEAR